MIYQEQFSAGEFIARESGTSRQKVLVASGQELSAGHVLGRIDTLGFGTPTFNGTGNGTIAMDPTTPVLAAARVGVYDVRCVTTAPNGGTFEVVDPTGFVLGQVAVGTEFATHLKFTISDGDSDFAAGDRFSITVFIASSKVRELNPSGNDGSQNAYGVLFDRVRAVSGDSPGAAISADAVVFGGCLTWPAGITDDQRAVAVAQLKRRGVVVQ